MTKKCDVKGCKRKAEYFFPDNSLCFIHYKELEREASGKVVGKETLLDWKAEGVSLYETRKEPK